MAVVYHEIYLPIDTESTFDYIVIKQGDAGTHKVRATLITNNRVYTIPTSGASYFMKFRKPDNNYCLVEATVSDNTISAEVTEEMLRVSGTGRGEFMIVSGSNELKTATFHVKIVRQTFTSGDVQSHSDFAPFAALLQGAGAAASNANTAAAAANAAASLATQKAEAIPDDYSELVADVAGKADKSTTYTKNEVDQMIEDVEVETDTTLAVSGAPADAKKTGDELSALKANLDALEPGISESAKAALLACLRNVAWSNANGQTYYNAFENALNPDVYPKITATFSPGSNAIYADDSLNSLKQYLTVKYYETEQSSGETISSSNYILIGELSAGLSSIAVEYDELITSFAVSAIDFYNIWEWDYSDAAALRMTRNNGAAGTYDAGSSAEYRYAPYFDGDSTAARTAFYVSKGKTGAYVVSKSGAEITPNMFLIPIPETATSVTAEITPSSQYLAVGRWVYKGNGKWERGAETGWQQGSGTLAFDAAQNQYISINCKPASQRNTEYGTTYPRPSVKVTFS